MSNNDYKPVSCEFHSSLELWIMHAVELEMQWQVDDEMKKENIIPLDIKTDSGAEYLFFTIHGKNSVNHIRLDKITHLEVVKTV